MTAEHARDDAGGAAVWQRRKRPWCVPITLGGISAALVLFGFLWFAGIAMREPDPITGPTDGILVLTGADHRIAEGARLLAGGAGRRLLISGVNSQTNRDALIKLSGLDRATFGCCVDLGYAAQDTIGNAEEARAWASGLRARRLIVVTSGYHMPRSLAELSIAMPGVELVPYPVVPKSVRDRAWWLQPKLMRLLATEYAKFLPVAARYALVRHLTPMVHGPQAVSAAAGHISP